MDVPLELLIDGALGGHPEAQSQALVSDTREGIELGQIRTPEVRVAAGGRVVEQRVILVAALDQRQPAGLGPSLQPVARPGRISAGDDLVEAGGLTAQAGR